MLILCLPAIARSRHFVTGGDNCCAFSAVSALAPLIASCKGILARSELRKRKSAIELASMILVIYL